MISMDTLIQDLRYAVRTLRKSPGFTAVAVTTLALGIGANAAIFSIVDVVLLRSLPFDDPDRIVRVWAADRESGEEFLESTFADIIAFREQNRSFSEVAAFSLAPRYLTDPYGGPSTATVARISGDLFRVLGISPAYGRGFLPEDARSGERVVILSHRIWRGRYGGDPDILGRTISIRQQPYTVVGIMPASYDYPKAAEMWRPFSSQEYQDDDRELQVIARLAPGVTVEQASEDVGLIARGLEELNPDNANITAWVQPMHSMLVRNVRVPLILLLSAVGVVLLIACANIANLLLARKTSREREISVRIALGAGRSRLLRQLLTESLLVALLGGVAGITLGHWVLDFIVSISPADTPRILEVALDGRVIAIMAAVTVLAGVAFGTLPALQASKANFRATLMAGGGGAGATTVTKQRAQRGLVVAEIALSTVMVIGAALLITSFNRQLRLDRGFETERILTVPIHPPGHFESNANVLAFFNDIQSRVRQIPGVESAVMSTTSPMDPLGLRVRVRVQGGAESAGSGQGQGRGGRPQALVKMVSTRFFEALGIELIRGRTFTDRDDVNGQQVAVVNEAFSRAFLGDGDIDPVGRVVETYFPDLRIVGVVSDLTPQAGSVQRPTMYLAFNQFPIAGVKLMVRTAGDPLDLAPAIRDLIWERDPTIPLNEISTIERAITATVASPRFNMFLVGLFASLALILAAVGVYGVTSYTVGQRTREIGLRQALGAQEKSLLWMVLGQGVKMAAIGVAIGLLGAFWLSRLIASLLYDVAPTDPVTFATVALILVMVATAACYFPARRALAVDPVEALRSG